MKEITFHIDDYIRQENADADIICVEPLNGLTDIVATSVVTLTGRQWEIKIRFDWKDDSEINESDFLFVPETNVIFFKTHNQWGVIDITTKTLKRHENACWSLYIEINESYIYIQDDLIAETTKLNGDKIHSVPIDPPTESKDFDDRIEFNSPVMGRQVLWKR